MTDRDEHERRAAAELLLRAGYNGGRPYLDPRRAMEAVRSAAFGYGTLPGDQPPVVPADDLLAALTLVAEVRADLDRLERELMRGARDRGASWRQVADYRGLRTRQAAESRYLRLERVTGGRSSGRDVPAQRLDRARERVADDWCRRHAEPIAAAAAALDEHARAWPALERELGARMLDPEEPWTGARLRHLYGLVRVHTVVAPAGERPEEAAAARDAVVDLALRMQSARADVHSARRVGDTDPAGSADTWVSSDR